MAPSQPVRPSSPRASQSLWQKIGWFAAIWIASVLSLGLVAYGIKWLLR